MRELLGAVALAALLGCCFGTASAQNNIPGGDPAAGQAFARQFCATCHLTSADPQAPGKSTGAPSFRSIANAQGKTAASIRHFLSVDHPTMPNMSGVLSPQQVSNLVSYITSMRNQP